VFSDPQDTNKAPVADTPVGSPELPRADGPLDGGVNEPVNGGPNEHLDEFLLDPPLVPLSELGPPAIGRGRRRLGRLAPAALLLPLALVTLLIYLLQVGRPQQAEPIVQMQPTAVAPATPQRSVGSTREEPTAPPPASVSADELDGLLAEAQALTWQSKFEGAVAIYQELARQSPDDARPQIGWARTMLLEGLPDQALSHARLALALDPGSVEAAIALAAAYVGVGDRTRGLSAAEHAVRLGPDSAEAHALLADVYLLRGQLGQAVEAAEMALAQDSGSAEAHRVRGRLYEVVDNDLEGAIREFRLAASLQPRLWLRHYDLGLALLKAKDYDVAITALTEAWVLRRSLLTYNALGQAYYRLGQYDRAASYLEQSLAAGAWNVDTYALLASINAQRDRCSDAMTYVNHALTQDPNHPLALEARDICLAASSAPIATAAPPSTAQAQAAVPTPPPPVGGWIAFPLWNAETGQYDTYLGNVDGSERRRVVEGMHQPAFSPDGQWLAVNGERHEQLNLFIVRPDGRDLQEITAHVEDGLPSWSPAPLEAGTGERGLAFSSTRHGDKQSRIYVLDRLPFDGRKVEARALNAGPDDVRGEYPAWIMDVGPVRVVYAGCHYDGLSAQCGLMLMPAEPGSHTPQPLTAHPADTAPAVYGSRVAFMSTRHGNWEIYLVNSDGSGLRRLTHNASNDGLPTWSPDGSKIAFVSDEGGTWAVWTVNPDGSDRRRLFDLGGSGLAVDWQHERISWGPDFALAPSTPADAP